MRRGFEGVIIWDIKYNTSRLIKLAPLSSLNKVNPQPEKFGQCRLTEVLIRGSCPPVCGGMDTFPFVYPHVLGECQIQPAEPDELGLMPQGSDHSSTVFFYPRDKHRSDREDRVAAIRTVYQST